MIKPGEIQKIASSLKVKDTQIEKDYVLGWILKGISQNNFLSRKLAFKGGTTIRKFYIANYRLSEDLDFTFTDMNMNATVIKSEFDHVLKWVALESRLTLVIRDEKIHNTGNYVFYIGYIGPLGGSINNKSIKVDICNDEKLCNATVDLSALNEYSDLKDEYKINCYSIREIIAEKMRSLMQRTMPRDLYDLWFLLEVEGYNILDFISDFQEKARYKNLDPDMFVNTVISKEVRFKNTWNNYLTDQIKDLEDFDTVWRNLNKHFRIFDGYINS